MPSEEALRMKWPIVPGVGIDESAPGQLAGLKTAGRGSAASRRPDDLCI